MLKRLWTRAELIVAINLYCKLPFGKLHKSNPEIIKVANLLGRTPSSVAWKLVNFASFDPSLKARGIKGASNVSNLDKQIWNEFYNNWESLSYESEKLFAELQNKSIEQTINIPEFELREGKMREQVIKARINQAFFRSSILAAYNSTCCITGLKNPVFLIASHIATWVSDEKNRLNPRNGLCLNSLHDKAFEVGLITITPFYTIKISSVLKKDKRQKAVADYFLKYDNQSIIMPSRFLPDPDLLTLHNKRKIHEVAIKRILPLCQTPQ